MTRRRLVPYSRSAGTPPFIAAEERPESLPALPFRLTILGFGHYHLRLPEEGLGTLHVLHGFGKIVTDLDVHRFCGPCAIVLPPRCTVVNLGAGTLEAIVDLLPPQTPGVELMPVY